MGGQDPEQLFHKYNREVHHYFMYINEEKQQCRLSTAARVGFSPF